MKIKICETCGSESVRIEALAEWDFDSQSWELKSTHDYSWCCDCDADTNIIDKEYEETTA